MFLVYMEMNRSDMVKLDYNIVVSNTLHKSIMTNATIIQSIYMFSNSISKILLSFSTIWEFYYIFSCIQGGFAIYRPCAN